MNTRDRSRDFRALMGRFATGVTVVACGDPLSPHAMTANSVTSVSLDPPMLLVCVRNQSRWLPMLQACGHFSVNVLRADQRAISQRFAGLNSDDASPTWTQRLGAPLLTGAAASFACRVDATYPAGDHTIVVGEVVGMEGDDSPPDALIYLKGQYRSLPFTTPCLQHSS